MVKTKEISKKAQVGLTLTWFVAFLIIFFIMIIFIVLSGALAGGKVLGVFGVGFSSIDLINDYNSLLNQRMFFNYLDTPVNENEKIRDLIIGIDKPRIKEETGKFFEKLEGKCYYIELNYASGEKIKMNKMPDKYDIDSEIADPNFVGGGNIKKQEINTINLDGEYSSEVDLLAGKKLNVLFYTEKC